MGKTLSTGLLTNAISTNASNNVGIGGDADASAKLKVTGAAIFNGATFSGTNAVDVLGSIRTDGASNGINLRNGFTATITNPNNNTRDIRFDQDTTGTFMFKANGNMGIGTSSPYNPFGGNAKSLEIRSGDTTSIPTLWLRNSNASASLGFYINPSGAATIGTSSSHDLQLVTNDTERLRITTSGDIQAKGPIYRYNGQTIINGSYTNLTSIDSSNARTYLLQVVSVNSEALTNYRWFGVIQWNSASSSYAITPLAFQTMDVTFSGTTLQIRTSNGQQYTFNWSITQLL